MKLKFINYIKENIINKHDNLTEKQKELTKKIENEYEDIYKEELKLWKKKMQNYYKNKSIFNTRLYIIEPPKKKIVECICNKCIEKNNLILINYLDNI